MAIDSRICPSHRLSHITVSSHELHDLIKFTSDLLLIVLPSWVWVETLARIVAPSCVRVVQLRHYRHSIKPLSATHTYSVILSVRGLKVGVDSPLFSWARCTTLCPYPNEYFFTLYCRLPQTRHFGSVQSDDTRHESFWDGPYTPYTSNYSLCGLDITTQRDRPTAELYRFNNKS